MKSDIPHILQLNPWDCGLACVAMVLQAAKKKGRLQDLHKRVSSDNVWTIELAYILREYQLSDFSILLFNI